MDIKIQVWLLDIKQCIDEIFLFLGPEPDFKAYQLDLKTKKAVERNLEIMGEAMKRIIRADSSIQINNALNIIGTRNRIVHGYDSISDEVIFTIVCQDLPKLRVEIENLMGAG